jgi:preprotein translocase subunit YajC
LKDSGRLGKVTKITEDRIEVKLLSGSTVVAPKSYFINKTPLEGVKNEDKETS